MMALSKQKGISVRTYLLIAILLCTLTSQVEPKRVRRQVDCQDGEYEHDGRKCCFCPVGYKVAKHCTDQVQTQCEECPTEQFQSHVNQEMKCEECRKCENNPNANLVLDESCTPYTDSTCKCKANHYCPSARKHCSICEPCKECGPEGEKVACSATNNTVCNDKPQGSSPLGAILGVIIPLSVLVAAVLFYCCYWRKRKESTNLESGHVDSAEAMPFRPVAEPDLPERLTPYIPDIAEVIGWKTMRNLGMNNHIPNGIIESCEYDHPNNSVERTIALLKIWEEKESKNAAHKLINCLKQANQKSTADDVEKILRASSSNGSA